VAAGGGSRAARAESVSAALNCGITSYLHGTEPCSCPFAALDVGEGELGRQTGSQSPNLSQGFKAKPGSSQGKELKEIKRCIEKAGRQTK